MKILMTTMGLDIGGAETHIVELTKELKRLGHQVVLASNGGVYETVLKDIGVKHVKIPMHQRSIGSMIRSLRLLRTLILEEKPELVHAHARIPAFLCGILHKFMKFPFITSAHWVFEVTPLLRLMTDWGQRTVAVSEDIKVYLKENYQVPADQIHVTINGIDTEAFAPCEKDEALLRNLELGSGPIIATVSRLDESRELAARQLIGVMPKLMKAYPSAQLLVVGGGNMEHILLQEAQEVNRTTGKNTVIMTGPRTDISQLISLCDVFVGVSRSALEAMAAEKPAILAGNEGYVGIFEESKLKSARESNFCCRGYESSTSEKLLRDLERLLKMQPQERLALGKYSRQVVLDHYSVHAMTEDYLAAYEKLLSPPKVTHAVVSGYYGYGNLGDDAILEAISRQLQDPEHPVRLTALSRNPKETEKHYGLMAVQRFHPVAVYKALKRADILISGGGSLLQDKTSTRSLLYYLAVIRLARRMKKKVFIYANGIGPLLHERNRKQVKKCLEHCDVITLRDRESLEELRNLGLCREDAQVTGDPVFILKPYGIQNCATSNYGIPEGASIVGVSVRNLPVAEHFINEFARLCDRLSQQDGKTIVFIVMQESMDGEITQQIRQKMTQPSWVVRTPDRPEQMLSLIREMELVVSVRLHTLVFAANMNVPVVGCVYDPKVAAMLKLLGMPECGTPENIDADETYILVKKMLEHLPEQKQALAARVVELTHKAEENGRIFRQILK